MHQNAVEKMPEYVRYISEQGMENFYYLEVYPAVEKRLASPILQELQKKYHTVCATKFFWVQVLKFNTQLAANPADVVKSCPRSIAVLPSAAVVNEISAEGFSSISSTNI
jgi:hypothetical protein